MSAARLAQLEEENASLRRLQTLDAADARIGRLVTAGLTPKLARLALLLFDRPGKAVGVSFIIEAFDLMGAVEPMAPKDVSVWAYKLRRALGRQTQTLGTVRTVGYRLTPAGLAKIAAMLA